MHGFSCKEHGGDLKSNVDNMIVSLIVKGGRVKCKKYKNKNKKNDENMFLKISNS